VGFKQQQVADDNGGHMQSAFCFFAALKMSSVIKFSKILLHLQNKAF
jgi:hypothetical protein